MPTRVRRLKKLLTIEDGPQILSKFLLILDNEADRLLALPVEQRTKDMKHVISASTFLTTMNKVEMQQEKIVRSEVAGTYNKMSAYDVQQKLRDLANGSS